MRDRAGEASVEAWDEDGGVDPPDGSPAWLLGASARGVLFNPITTLGVSEVHAQHPKQTGGRGPPAVTPVLTAGPGPCLLCRRARGQRSLTFFHTVLDMLGP